MHIVVEQEGKTADKICPHSIGQFVLIGKYTIEQVDGRNMSETHDLINGGMF